MLTMLCLVNNKHSISNVLRVFMLVCSCFAHPGMSARFVEEPASATFDVEAVQNGIAKLPCNITPSLADDKPLIVIWFKDDGVNRKTNIYSFDARDKSPEEGTHWHDEQVLGARAYFRFQDDPAKLTLDNVRESDEGIYHCRVDFLKTPTRNVLVNLTVIIPPKQLRVLDDTGDHISDNQLGPYNEGTSINITCVATGGRPLPKVTWWQENALLDDSFEYLSERRVRNVLHLEKVERKHLHTVFTCQAANNNLITPISSSVTLDINLRPLRVKLLGENKPLSADSPHELTCEVVGSRPVPTITWWKGSVQMKNTRETTSPDHNVTTSVLTFQPKVEDGGKFLSCRGQQPHISDSGLEDGWKLDIHHVPIVTLELGSNLNGSTIKEGDDVYFECNIKSNPWVYKVSWRHNGKQLFNNFHGNTIVSNQSLVLQSVTRARSGIYTCMGHNKEGDRESNPVQLDVKFIPVCRPGPSKVFGVARHETARILCELEANPTDVQFIWKFNNSADTVDIPQNQIHSERTRSTASYKPMTELDYGTLLCWGKNEIGMQKEPCVFYINPAGKPDSLTNCTILNQTAESLHVECTEGFDGGLQQEFIMEVYDTQTRKLVSNVTSKNPIFTVGGLESGLGFDVGLYASNKKGRSDVTHLQAFTLKSAEKHTVSANRKPPSPKNCVLAHQTHRSVRIKCELASNAGKLHLSYILQVYHANSRILIGTSTSQAIEEIVFSDLPEDHDDLLLFVRTMDSKSITSDANIIYVPVNMQIRNGASTPSVLLNITPLLGAVIGIAGALILVAVIIVIVIRLRGGGERDDKDYDEGGGGGGGGIGGGLTSSTGRRAGNNADKASTEPLNKDLNDSVDSLEEKNPDIIPQNNGEDDYQDEERAFDRLNNAAPLRVYSRLQSPNNLNKNGNYDGYCPKAMPHPPHVIYNQQAIPMSVIRRQEPTVYAQIDMKRVPQCLQPLSPPHPSTFHTLQHPHIPAYIQRQDIHQQILHHDGTINAETPLLNTRDASSLQPLLEGNGSSRTPTITSTLPRTVTATRF